MIERKGEGKKKVKVVREGGGERGQDVRFFY